MKALEAAWPFVPEVRLFHSREKCQRFIRKHMSGEPTFLSAGAQMWYEDDLAVVLFEADASWHAEAALLAHEAVHVAVAHYNYMGEEHPNEEFLAYLVQVVSRALFEAHEKWKRDYADPK